MFQDHRLHDLKHEIRKLTLLSQVSYTKCNEYGVYSGIIYLHISFFFNKKIQLLFLKNRMTIGHNTTPTTSRLTAMMLLQKIHMCVRVESISDI